MNDMSDDSSYQFHETITKFDRLKENGKAEFGKDATMKVEADEVVEDDTYLESTKGISVDVDNDIVNKKHDDGDDNLSTVPSLVTSFDSADDVHQHIHKVGSIDIQGTEHAMNTDTTDSLAIQLRQMCVDNETNSMNSCELLDNTRDQGEKEGTQGIDSISDQEVLYNNQAKDNNVSLELLEKRQLSTNLIDHPLSDNELKSKDEKLKVLNSKTNGSTKINGAELHTSDKIDEHVNDSCVNTKKIAMIGVADGLNGFRVQASHNDKARSESSLLSFYSCREESSGIDVGDNVSSIISFHTALNIASASVSERDNISEQFGSDFLTCRSNEDISTHLYDLSSRIDDRSDFDSSNSLQTYYTCPKLNHQGLRSILKNGDESGNNSKKCDIPLDILTPGKTKSTHKERSLAFLQLVQNRKFVYFIGPLMALVVLGLPISVGLLLRSRQSSNNVTTNEIYPVVNDTFTNGIPAVVYSQSPSQAPSTLRSTNFTEATLIPSQSPSIYPTISHPGGIFSLRRPPKKKKSNVTMNFIHLPEAP
jgi:hypothetical protein